MISDNLKKIKIDISEDNDKITCNVEIDPRGRFCRQKILVDTRTLELYLKNKGYKFILGSSPHVEIKNYQQGISNKHTWEFRKEKKTVPKRRTTRKKIQLDK
ncbi:MAG: hypothetical protein CMI75_08645 [Candidatus Pelagibacter sp.]|jgi:hypothetical protein|nr:hypothetical protein [Candidatus Pelagibacter sp.]|tara:strand:- start:5751 stop:6056 length:306 start_codon:yes stop_codon:yes gene_type:complete